MKRIISFSLSIFIAVCLLIASEHQAFGYVDPGSGLLALQSIGAALAACGYFLRRHLRRFFDRSAPVKVPVLRVTGTGGKPAKVA